MNKLESFKWFMVGCFVGALVAPMIANDLLSQLGISILTGICVAVICLGERE